MIQAALIVLSGLTILIGALLGFAPNFQRVIDSDFDRRSYDYANFRVMEQAKLQRRAGTLPMAQAAQGNPGDPYYCAGGRCMFIPTQGWWNATTGKIDIRLDSKEHH